MQGSHCRKPQQSWYYLFHFRNTDDYLLSYTNFPLSTESKPSSILLNLAQARDVKAYQRAKNVGVKKSRVKSLQYFTVFYRESTFFGIFWHMFELHVTFWDFLHYLGPSGLLRYFVGELDSS